MASDTNVAPPTLPPPLMGDPLLGIEQIAQWVGVAQRTIRREIARSNFPPPDARIGRLLRWKMTTLALWLENQAPGGRNGK
ncbi:MAG: helix-turn-helix domain-containing protein [Phycisphaerae bacterium]|nr:helix-turn-helix domain-containing protein [Phycisphaerae bacterium]